MLSDIFNEQNDLDIDHTQVEKLVCGALAFLSITCDEVGIHFVTEEKITDLHGEFFNDPTPTDCISFPIDEIPGHKSLGEVFICPKAALSYPDPHAETSLYIVHGLLHLIGYKDHTDAMAARQTEAMDHLKNQSLLLCK